MPPNRSITDFFKPAAPDSRPILDNIVVQHPDSNPARPWPSPRVPNRLANTATREAAPSPAPRCNPRVTDVTPKPKADNVSATASFSSLTSASQTPPSSNNSRRMVKNGDEVVCNSDSETDSSDDELEDLDKFLRKPSPAPAQKRAVDGTQRSLSGRQTRSGDSVQKERAVPQAPPAKKYKFSLSSLVDASNNDSEAEKKIAEAKIELDKPVEDSAQSEDVHVDETILTSIIEDEEDGDKAQRLLLAMKRTNALHRDPTWHFFYDDIENKSRQPFPALSLPRYGWAAMFKDPTARDQAFLSGYARTIFRHQELPEELASWMIDELIYHPREDLKFEYLQTLKSCPRSLKVLLTPSKLTELFGRLGAKDKAANPASVMDLSFEAPSKPKRPIPSGLRWVVLLLGQAASTLPLECRVHAINVLLRVSFDDSVLADATLQITIQDSIEALISSLPDSDLDISIDQITNTILSTLKDPILQDQLISSLPTHSPLTHHFQRHLALSFFLSPTPLGISLTSPILPSLIHTHLTTSPSLQITPRTSYPALGAIISLLDTAIGPGFSDLSFLPSRPLPNTPAAPLVPEEKAFNESVDLLASRVKWLSNRIIDAGATDMSRCEAKGVCERLYYRLESAVRTRGRRQRGVFGGDDDDDDDEGARKLLRRWFKNSTTGSEAVADGA